MSGYCGMSWLCLEGEIQLKKKKKKNLRAVNITSQVFETFFEKCNIKHIISPVCHHLQINH